MREGWTYKRLGEVCDVVMGQSPDGESVNGSNGIEFHQGKIFFGEKFLNESNSYTNKPSKIAEPDSVLLCVRAPVGIANITSRKICIGRGLCAIKPKYSLLLTFLFYTLIKKKEFFDKYSTGTTFKAISSKVVTNAVIPIPPLSIQQSIVAELDKINELIGLKKSQLNDLDCLAQSIFFEMFGDPMENEKGWEVKKLKEIGRILTGNTPSKAVPEYYDENFIEWIKTDNIEKNLLYATEAKEYLSKKGANCGRVVNKGSLLIACIAGSLDSIGKACVTDRHVAFNQQINAIVPYEIIDILFLYHLITRMKGIIQERASTGMKHILTKSVMEEIPVPLPPLSLQQSFAARITAIEQQKQRISASIKDLDTLLASRMQYWFDG